ncbi:MAG TPA: hypothetical protein VKT82_31610, partial [Ktedonobacterales bacterium]|nr:hypothetical protein [Ktedonobacterales bacterium]
TGRTEPASDLYALGATLYFALTASDPQLLTIFDIHLHWQQGISFPPERDRAHEWRAPEQHLTELAWIRGPQPSLESAVFCRLALWLNRDQP